MPTRPRIGLVIGSGAVKCLAALGLFQVLEREGIGIDLAVGCSGGSIYASLLALNHSVEAMEQASYELWTSKLIKGYAASLSAIRSGEKRFTERSGLIDDGPTMKALETTFGDATFADAQIPLYITATDFRNGEMVVLQQGSMVDSIRASIAIPTVYSPWEINGRLLVDGATSNPLPVDIAIQQGADIIIAMGFELDYRSRMRSLTAVNTHLNSIYINNLLRTSMAFHTIAHHHEIIQLMPQFDRSISAFDVQHIPYIIQQGQQTAERELPYLKTLLKAQGAVSRYGLEESTCQMSSSCDN